jgi:uncharacterized protein YndB with AHSA1/START domain
MGDSRSVVEDGLLEVSLTRRVSAPPEIVFRAWTDARQMAEWWGPKDFITPVCESNPRVGGEIRVEMLGPNEVAHRIAGRFIEIDRPRRLVFTEAVMDGEGQLLFEVHNSVNFTAVESGTEIALASQVTQVTRDAPQYLSGMSQGWSQSLDRLGALVVRS